MTFSLIEVGWGQVMAETGDNGDLRTSARRIFPVETFELNVEKQTSSCEYGELRSYAGKLLN